MRQTVSIKIDDTKLSQVLSELQSAQLSPEIRNRLLHLLDSSGQLVRLDVDCLAAPVAGECRVALEPSDALLDALAATRAREGDARALVDESHGNNPPESLDAGLCLRSGPASGLSYPVEAAG